MSARFAAVFVIGLVVSLAAAGVAIWRGNLALKASEVINEQQKGEKKEIDQGDRRLAIPEFLNITQTSLKAGSDFSLGVKVSNNSNTQPNDLVVLVGARGIRTEDMPTITFKFTGKGWYSGVDWYFLEKRDLGFLGDTPWQNSYTKKVKQVVSQELDDEGRAPLVLAVLKNSELEKEIISDDQVYFVDRSLDSPFLKTAAPKSDDLEVSSSTVKLRNEKGDLYSISNPNLPSGTPLDFPQNSISDGNIISYSISVRNKTEAKDIDLKLRPVGFEAEILSFDLPPAPYEILDFDFKPEQILAGSEMKPTILRKRLETAGKTGDNFNFNLVLKIKGFSNFTPWQKITQMNVSKIMGFISVLVRVSPTNSDNLSELYYQTGLKYRVFGLESQIQN